jgi:hypothetical protein
MYIKTRINNEGHVIFAVIGIGFYLPDPGKASACHTELRELRERNEAAIMAVLTDRGRGR